MIKRLTKYELWNALQACPEEVKTDAIKELESELNKTMSVGYTVWVDDKTD